MSSLFGRIATWRRNTTHIKGYRMVPSNLKVLAKFGLCSNCSQKLHKCSLAQARKIFASARMLGFSLKFPVVKRKHNLHLEKKNRHWKQCFPCGKLGNTAETCARHECFWKNASSFCWSLLKLAGLSSVPGSRLTLPETGGLSLHLLRGNLLACKQDLRKIHIPFSVHPLTLVKLSEVISQQTAY